MLKSLSIRNIVLIDQLDIDLTAGMTVLTGETGAGKSILLDALGLVLGGRADADLIREGVPVASVAARFDLRGLPEVTQSLVAERLEAAGLETLGLGLVENSPRNAPQEPEDLVCRRVLYRDRTSRAFINDQPVTLALLKAVGTALVHLHGQFDAALTPAQQRVCVDRYGALEPLVARVGSAYAHLDQTQQQLAEAEAQRHKAHERIGFLNMAVQDLSAAQLQAGQEKTLTDERHLLSNAAKITDALHEVVTLMGHAGTASGEGILPKLFGASRAFQKIAGHSDALTALTQQFESCVRDLEDVHAEVQHMLDHLSSQRYRLNELDDRLHQLRTLARKYACGPDDLSAYLDQAVQELQQLTTLDDRIHALQQAHTVARAHYIAEAEALTRARRQAADQLAGAIEQEFPALKLEHARFFVQVTALPESQWSRQGADAVAFLVSTNAATQAGPLSHIASGGERARIELALRATLATALGAPTLIFDEVDSGIGGAVAAAVGQRLQHLSASVQVLVITHSPQVAANGHAHLHVMKSADAERIATTVSLLNWAEREEEIARMLAGATLTDAARVAAKHLLAAAQLEDPSAPSSGADHLIQAGLTQAGLVELRQP